MDRRTNTTNLSHKKWEPTGACRPAGPEDGYPPSSDTFWVEGHSTRLETVATTRGMYAYPVRQMMFKELACTTLSRQQPGRRRADCLAAPTGDDRIDITFSGRDSLESLLPPLPPQSPDGKFCAGTSGRSHLGARAPCALNILIQIVGSRGKSTSIGHLSFLLPRVELHGPAIPTN